MKKFLHPSEITHLNRYVKKNRVNNEVDWSKIDSYCFQRTLKELQDFYEKFIINYKPKQFDLDQVNKLIDLYDEIFAKHDKWQIYKRIQEQMNEFSVKQITEAYESPTV